MDFNFKDFPEEIWKLEKAGSVGPVEQQISLALPHKNSKIWNWYLFGNPNKWWGDGLLLRKVIFIEWDFFGERYLQRRYVYFGTFTKKKWVFRRLSFQPYKRKLFSVIWRWLDGI